MAGKLTEIDEARERILAKVSRLESESIELAGALDRVLAEELRASRPVPAFDSSAMDGFAVRSDDVSAATPTAPTVLRLAGESRAGAPSQIVLAAGQAIAISTGAMLPAGADSVVPVEDTCGRGGTVEILVAATPGQDVRRSGEDIVVGQSVLSSGLVLGPAELGVLGAMGRARVTCRRASRVSLLVTGDELREPGQATPPGTIYDSSSHSIGALARRAGAEIVHCATTRDELDATTTAIACALEGVDVAVICGGVSVGEHDHVRASLRALGATQELWGIALKPGRPTWFGTRGKTLVFGLPGNPVSAMVTFILLVAPALHAMLGIPAEDHTMKAILDRDYEKPAGRAHAVRCRLSAREDGWHATPTGAQDSHLLSSMLAADALAMIPSQSTLVSAGERVQIQPLRNWVGAFL
jgi:molybdopterin molybdotransferase